MIMDGSICYICRCVDVHGVIVVVVDGVGWGGVEEIVGGVCELRG